MKYDNQLRYAVKVIEDFGGEMPLHGWLRNFYKKHPQMGSRDRKLISGLVYNFYRLGHAQKNLNHGERILLAVFLCGDASLDLLNYFKPSWNKQIADPINAKLQICRHDGIDFDPSHIFPWKDQLSQGIDHAEFCRSFLAQPDLFIRIRPGQEKKVLSLLKERQIPFERLSSASIRLPNGTAVNKIFKLNMEIVVQDLSSQKVGDFFSFGSGLDLSKARAWDCCAGSGGKSILLYDKYPRIDLTVSDIRPAIMTNLKKRFEEAGISNYKSFVADLAKGEESASALNHSFDLIILDAPCSGSGTWARTPEELYFFEESRIGKFSTLQEEIIEQVIPKLKKNGKLVYITCSVFRKENEDMATYISNRLSFAENEISLLNGIPERADAMFVAAFKT